MKYSSRIEEGRIIAYAPFALYSKDVVLKCLYWYGDKFTVSIDVVAGEAFEIELLAATPMTPEDLQLYQQKLTRDLIDFNLRDIVTKETQNVRDLLIAKAFSHGEFDEVPVGEVSDPVGYTPLVN